jgi:hypothetical protein
LTQNGLIMPIWKWMIQNTYLHIYHEDGWSAPTIMILYVSPNVHKQQAMESRQISNTYLPRMSHTSFTSQYNHGKMCQMNVSSLSFVIVLMAIDISMSHAHNWKKLVQYMIISQCLYTYFCFDHYIKWIKFWATFLQDLVMSWIHHQVI